MKLVEVGQREAHVARADLTAYVMNALECERKDAVELHVLACDSCSASLAREARLEAAFEAVARRSVERSSVVVPLVGAAVGMKGDVRARHARQHRWMGGVAGALAAAAAVVLALASAKGEPAGGLGARAHAWDDSVESSEGALRGTLAESGFVESSHDNLDGG